MIPEPAHAQRTGLLAVLVPIVDDLYFSGFLGGAAESAYEHGTQLLLSSTKHEHAREVSLLDRMLRLTDGAMIVLPEESSAELELALGTGYPFVVVDPLVPLDPRIPVVSAAHRSGALQATEHLIALGHHRIGALTGPPGWTATEDRRAAYHDALTAAGIAHESDLEVAADFEFGPGVEAARVLLELPDPPTAIFAFNDALGLGVLRAARERGLRVPEDLSVVGFDDLKFAEIASPALTTVRQPLVEMGRAGISLLLQLMDPSAPVTHRVELPTRLVVRDSTAPPLR